MRRENIIALSFMLFLGALLIYLALSFYKRDNFTSVPLLNFANKTVIPTERVVVSFTTIPSRVKYIPTVIERLKQQSLRPDITYVCIPHYSNRKNMKYDVPEGLDFGPKVKIVRCEDYGPATKLLGCIPYESDPNTMIITIDDDQKYPIDTIKYLVGYAEKYPDHRMSYSTLSEPHTSSKCYGGISTTGPNVKYMEGFSAPLYRRKHVITEMIDYFEKQSHDYSEKQSHDCFVSDDLTISTWLNMQNVKMIRICGGMHPNIDFDIDKNALHRENRKGAYEKCSKEMLKLEIIRTYISTKSYFFMADEYTQNILDGGIKTFGDDDFRNIKNRSVVCICSYMLGDFINKIFTNLTVPIILITTDSDESIPSDIWRNIPGGLNSPVSINTTRPVLDFYEFLNDPRLLHWYSSNLEKNFQTSKITPIPLGVDYHTLRQKGVSTPYIQDTGIREISLSLPSLSERPLSVFANFNVINSSRRHIHTIGEDRKSIRNQIKNNSNIHFQDRYIERDKCWLKHGEHSFVISPHGMGLDCHRTWEALILGCIPIVKSSPIDSVYKDLPIVILDSWAEITKDNLYKWKSMILDKKWNMEKLTTKYWEKDILGKKM